MRERLQILNLITELFASVWPLFPDFSVQDSNSHHKPWWPLKLEDIRDLIAPRAYTLPLAQAIQKSEVQGRNYGPQVSFSASSWIIVSEVMAILAQILCIVSFAVFVLTNILQLHLTSKFLCTSRYFNKTVIVWVCATTMYICICNTSKDKMHNIKAITCRSLMVTKKVIRSLKCNCYWKFVTSLHYIKVSGWSLCKNFTGYKIWNCCMNLDPSLCYIKGLINCRSLFDDWPQVRVNFQAERSHLMLKLKNVLRPFSHRWLTKSQRWILQILDFLQEVGRYKYEKS